MTAESGADRTRSLLAPAKVNLGLRLTGVRDDGYHLLESLFVPLRLADALEVRWSPEAASAVGLEIEIPGEEGLPEALADVTSGPDNLIVRAIERFRIAHPFEGRIDVRLTKRIPAGAGLGGGSSDAGAVLATLPGLLGVPAPDLA